MSLPGAQLRLSRPVPLPPLPSPREIFIYLFMCRETMMAMIIITMMMITIKARWWCISLSSHRKQLLVSVRRERRRSPALSAAGDGEFSFLRVGLKVRAAGDPGALSVLPHEAKNRAGERLGWKTLIPIPGAPARGCGSAQTPVCRRGSAPLCPCPLSSGREGCPSLPLTLRG